MKITINRQIFSNMIRAHSTFAFSDEGISALYDHLCDIEREQEDEMELDVQGLCDSYTEYQDGLQAAKSYDICLTEYLLHDAQNQEALVILKMLTEVIVHEFGIIVKNY